ncbi:MAG TPA: hypothetical protein VLD64_08745 [Nitrosarchaeum sp.]|nr:hypothetical protein [Nitrosarchaeum sp.]
MIIFNRAMIVAGIGGLVAGAIVAQLYSQYDDNKLANALFVLLIEYDVYIPFFAVLLFMDNRHKTHDSLNNNQKISPFKHYLMKLAASIVVSEGIYSITKITLHYEFLQLTKESYQASLASSLIGWVVFFVSINVLAKRFSLFRHDKANSKDLLGPK